MSTDRSLLVAAAAGLGGIGISVYLTVVHYAGIPLYCSTTGAVDCERVLSSGYAVIAGTTVPTSVAGIVWFTVSTLLAATRLAGLSSPVVTRIHFIWAGTGLATSLFLVFVEIVQLGAICIWCTGAHALVLVTFLAVLYGRR